MPITGTAAEDLGPEQDCEFEEGDNDDDPCRYRGSFSPPLATRHNLSSRPKSAVARISVAAKNQGERKTDLRKSLSVNTSPKAEVHYGIPLGTPAAKEAARSFWSMDMLQESLKKIATYTEESGYNSPAFSRQDSPSFSSLGSSSIAVDDPADSHSSFRHLPCIAVSAPPSPRSIQRRRDTESSVPRLQPLSASSSSLMAPKKRGEEAPRRSHTYPNSGALSPLLRATPPFVSPGVTRKMHENAPPLSVEGKQLKLSRKLMPLRKSNSFNSYLRPLALSAYENTCTQYCHSSLLTSDNGFCE